MIMNRVYGKPTETRVEVQQTEFDRVAAMSDEEREALRQRIEERKARLARMQIAE